MSDNRTPLNDILGRESDRSIPDRVLDELCELIHRETGLALDKKKYRMRLRRKIKRQMREQDIDEPDEYLERIRRESGDELRHLIEVVVVNETLVYRYPHQMRWLSETFFPDVLDSPPGTLRVLSAGCSTGAEPYSAAIALAEALRKQGISPEDVPFDIQILGIDISEDALAQARKGIYGRRPVQNAPEPLQERYFEKINEREFKVHPVLQDWTDFRKGNLLKCSLPSNNDLVLIRNVLIYFQESERRKILRRLYHEMSRKAPLIVGHAEDLSDYPQWFQPYGEAARGVYERWSTDRKERTVKESGTGDDSEPSTRKNVADPEITVDNPEPYRICIQLEGVFGGNLSPYRFRKKIEENLQKNCGGHCRDAQQCEIDLRKVQYFSNDNLGVFKNILKECLARGCEVFIKSDDEELVEDLESLLDSPWIDINPQPEEPSQKTSIEAPGGIDFNTISETKSETMSDDQPSEPLEHPEEQPETPEEEPSSEAGTRPSSKKTEQPRVDLQVLPEGLLFQLSGDWNEKQSPQELSQMLRHWIEVHEPDHVRILLTRIEGWDPGVVNVLERLQSIGTGLYDELNVVTDDPELATQLRDSKIPVRFESSIEEIVP